MAGLVGVQGLGQPFAAFRSTNIQGGIVADPAFPDQEMKKSAQSGQQTLQASPAETIPVQPRHQGAQIMHRDAAPVEAVQGLTGAFEIAAVMFDGVGGKPPFAVQMTDKIRHPICVAGGGHGVRPVAPGGRYWNGPLR